MRNLLPDDVVNVREADQPWTRKLTDRLLDKHFAGTPPGRIAQDLDRTPKAVRRQLEMFTRDEQGRASKYEPLDREDRRGRRFTENDNLILKSYRSLNVPVKVAVKVLQRDADELKAQVQALYKKSAVQEEVVKAKSTVRSSTMQLAPQLDFIWALRYIYFVYKASHVSDEVYDAIVQEEIEYGGGESAFEQIKHHSGWPIYIRSLAGYLVEKQKAQGISTKETYAIGDRDEKGDYGMYFGPVATLKEARSFDGKSVHSRIFELKGGARRAIGRWLVDEQRWEMHE